MFYLWNVFVLGLAATAVMLGWSDQLLHSGREAVVVVIGGLYLLSVALSCRVIAQHKHWVPLYTTRRVAGVDLVTRVVVLVGLAGTIYGVVVGTSSMGAASGGDTTAAVGALGAALGLGFTATLVSVLAAIAMLVSRHFLGNVVAHHG